MSITDIDRSKHMRVLHSLGIYGSKPKYDQRAVVTDVLELSEVAHLCPHCHSRDIALFQRMSGSVKWTFDDLSRQFDDGHDDTDAYGSWWGRCETCEGVWEFSCDLSHEDFEKSRYPSG